MSKQIVAVPSNGEGGIDGERAGHFGQCSVFTLFEIDNAEITNVSIVNNQEHQQGGCLVPVNLLASHNATALIVSGIGMRPLVGFNDAGIDVYHEAETAEIKAVIEKYISGNLQKMEASQACGGGGR